VFLAQALRANSPYWNRKKAYFLTFPMPSGDHLVPFTKRPYESLRQPTRQPLWNGSQVAHGNYRQSHLWNAMSAVNLTSIMYYLFLVWGVVPLDIVRFSFLRTELDRDFSDLICLIDASQFFGPGPPLFYPPPAPNPPAHREILAWDSHQPFVFLCSFYPGWNIIPALLLYWFWRISLISLKNF